MDIKLKIFFKKRKITCLIYCIYKYEFIFENIKIVLKVFSYFILIDFVCFIFIYFYLVLYRLDFFICLVFFYVYFLFILNFD